MSSAPALPVLPSVDCGPFVLLVDDHEMCLQLLREIVESAGHRCVTATSGADALVLCADHRPQAVVTDLSMPGVDGGVLAQWLRARYPTVPLVLLTGQDLDGPACDRLRETFTSILRKPVEPEHLLDVLGWLVSPCQPNPDGSLP
ncbi:MAG TPA: response regulator [Isosphaeraceae bacterium]|jgi:CheY-like chemotaxis protein|nr:response regulator [Isosphaeraceae bacterium]